MTYLVTFARVAAVCLAALVLQLSLDLRIFGVAPELLALIGMLAAIQIGSWRGAIVAFGAGLLWDVYLATPLGLIAICFALVAYSVGNIEEGLFHNTRTQVLVLVFAGTFTSIALYALIGAVLGQRNLLTEDLWLICLLAGAQNAALSLVVSPVVRWAVK